MDADEIFGKIKALRDALSRVILGKTSTIELAITALLIRGHLLIEDVPGVGKTTLAHALARSIDGSFRRIQFTSDLMPSDVIGVTIYNELTHSFEFRHGPIFANIVLADEINRATPRTQSSLLEAMNERQVSVENVTYAMPKPFMLLATQNPLEYAGAFPLPESQLDRFSLAIKIGYPDPAVEKEIIKTPPSMLTADKVNPVVTPFEVLGMQDAVEGVKVTEDLTDYMLELVRRTRQHKDIRLGASPRGAMTLFRASQAMALVEGRLYCIPDDIKKVAIPVLAHRIMPIRGGVDESTIEPRGVIEELLSKLSVPV